MRLQHGDRENTGNAIFGTLVLNMHVRLNNASFRSANMFSDQKTISQKDKPFLRNVFDNVLPKARLYVKTSRSELWSIQI